MREITGLPRAFGALAAPGSSCRASAGCSPWKDPRRPTPAGAMTKHAKDGRMPSACTNPPLHFPPIPLGRLLNSLQFQFRRPRGFSERRSLL